jgi:hypothetical protein
MSSRLTCGRGQSGGGRALVDGLLFSSFLVEEKEASLLEQPFDVVFFVVEVRRASTGPLILLA